MWRGRGFVKSTWSGRFPWVTWSMPSPVPTILTLYSRLRKLNNAIMDNVYFYLQLCRRQKVSLKDVLLIKAIYISINLTLFNSNGNSEKWIIDWFINVLRHIAAFQPLNNSTDNENVIMWSVLKLLMFFVGPQFV